LVPKLKSVETREKAPDRQKMRYCSALGHSPGVQHDYFVGVFNGTYPVGDKPVRNQGIAVAEYALGNLNPAEVPDEIEETLDNSK
jgi:hypothetical protein